MIDAIVTLSTGSLIAAATASAWPLPCCHTVHMMPPHHINPNQTSSGDAAPAAGAWRCRDRSAGHGACIYKSINAIYRINIKKTLHKFPRPEESQTLAGTQPEPRHQHYQRAAKASAWPSARIAIAP